MFSVIIRTKDIGRCVFQTYRSLSDISFADKFDLQTKLKIEAKWSNKSSDFQFKENEGNKFYVLSMFPYPSGNLHMGHVRVYTISDAVARYHRMKGKNVLHPMGFDAFGLPAENAAIQHKLDPSDWTYNNIKAMRSQLKSLGITFDWDREIITCSEDYYKFTQYIFLLLQKAGLVYRKEASVNWDPIDKTVLADEQIDSSGKSWRSGATVEKKIMKQWFFRTTRFASALKDGLNDSKLLDWRDVIDLQKHWIGECTGANFDFDLYSDDGQKLDTITLWIKYPEHVSKAEFIGVSTSSVFSIKNKGKGKLNCIAINPFNNRKLPIYITDDLEYDEGCDIKLGIPAVSESDKHFALNNNIEPDKTLTYEDYEKRLQICRLAIDAELGGYFVSSKLRDWLISRQRRWGTPIPVLHCKKCGTVPAREEDLPILVTKTSTICHQCNSSAEFETDTMDTFVDSSWYFLRYTDPFNSFKPFSQSKANELVPVDIYIGGKEHAVLHLYYARFMSYFLHSIGLLDEPEPFKRLLVQGMILGKTYYLEHSGKCLKKEEVENRGDVLLEKSTGMKVSEVWEKMSKSKFNGVEPDSVIKEYGIDTTRLLILSQVAPTSHRQWDSSTFSGVLNWQQRIWTLLADFVVARSAVDCEYNDSVTEGELWDARNFYIKGTTFNFEFSHQFNVAISKLQGLTNSLKKCKQNVMAKSLQFELTLASLVIMLYPLAPHFSCQLWESLQAAPNRIDVLGNYVNWQEPVFKQKWPQMDNEYHLELICKVNNAVKGSVKVPYHQLSNFTEKEALEVALAQKKVSSFVQGCDVLYCNYSYIQNHEATVNIIIDHMQRRAKVKAVQI